MRAKDRGAGRSADAVVSFITAFPNDFRSFDGVCIKYAMRDRTSRLAFFDQRWFRALYQCVEFYSGTHYNGSDMQREADEPGFAGRLPAHHPVLTMAREKPILADGEYEVAKHAHRVTSLRVNDLGNRCRLVCMYADGSRRAEVLPGYIAMYLCGHLIICGDLHGFLASTPVGTS